MTNNKIHIKMVTNSTLEYIRTNADLFAKKVNENLDNAWIKDTIPSVLYNEKTYTINDFELKDNSKGKNRDLDYNNAITLYENLKNLPRYILTDVKFWLWLILDKFYAQVKEFMPIRSGTTIKDHWLDNQNRRRAIFFNVLARLFFRVERTEENGDYTLTKWIFDNPERFRNLTWRTYSDNKSVVIATLKGCKAAVEEAKKENTDAYTEIATFVSMLGSATILDAYSEDELSKLVKDKMLELLKD